jgi:hypothetical protein
MFFPSTGNCGELFQAGIELGGGEEPLIAAGQRNFLFVQIFH